MQKTITRKIFILLLCITPAGVVLAQGTGSIEGTYKDAKNQEAIIGGTVRLENTTLAAPTDENGHYLLANVPAGTYTVIISSVSYKSLTLPKVVVTAGKTIALNGQLSPDNTQLGEVTVSGVRRTNTEVSVINEIRQANVVVSGISSEQIVKTQDRDAAEVVRRIPGVTIVDNRFIQVRGLSDRYNTVWLNDVTAPSSETDRKSFSFDIVPSSLIDRVLVFKDPSPELPGDFAGGLVKVYLRKPVFNEKQFTVNYSSGYRQGTTGRDFFTDRPQAGDAFGFGATKRDLPNGMPPLGSAYQQYERDFYARQLDNSFGIFKTKAMPDMRFNAAYLDQIHVAGLEIGSVSSINYTNTYTRFGIARNVFDGAGARTDQNQDDQSTQNIRLGAIQNFSLVLPRGGRLEWRNLFSQQARNQQVTREGADDNGTLNRRTYVQGYQGRTTYTGQLAGTHNFADEKTHLDWVGGYGYSARNEPDLRRVSYQVTPGTDKTPEVQTLNLPAPSVVDITNSGRLYQKLGEHIFTLNANLKRTVDVASRKVEIGAGTYLEYRRRSFRARVFGYSLNPGGMRGLLNENVGNVFSPQNIGTDGFRVDEDLNPTYRYNAHNELEAGYLSFNIPFTDKLKLLTGARFERNVQFIETGVSAQPVAQNVVTNFVLPSANLSYNINATNLVRASYGRSLNRPEFREAAPFYYYDFEFSALNYGSLYLRPDQPLKVATIDNFDLRYEWYPTPGELIHVGAFYKNFQNPIENSIVPTTNLAYTFTNAPSAYAYGVELDIKKNLTFVSERLKNLSLVGNVSLIKSQVTLGSNTVSWNSKRALQGQSPYVFNGGLYFNTPDNSWQVTGLYNVFGPRILFAGSDQYPDVVELPRHTVDISLTKTITPSFSLNAGVQDLFNQRVNLVQDYARDGKYTASDPSLASYRRGTYFTLGLRFSLQPRPATPVP
jgi:TonB-dependent receptor